MRESKKDRNMTVSDNITGIAQDVEAVITNYNHGEMLREAICSVYDQTVRPAGIIIVDDGSADEESVRILKEIEEGTGAPVPVHVIWQENCGVSVARNVGIRNTCSPLVLVLDGDDRLRPTYIEKVGRKLRESPHLAAASSWMQTFGALTAAVCPCGGDVATFLSHNCCPATHIMRRRVWELCGGYDESMRSGFEDWEFFLNMLEAAPDTSIGIVEEMLIEYRTASVSANIKSMDKCLEIMRFIIEKHIRTYQKHIADALLEIEAVSMERLFRWENEILHTLGGEQTISSGGEEFLKHPTYGDGGMAAAVRIVSQLNTGKDTESEKK